MNECKPFFVSLMITTKHKPIVDIEKVMIKESRNITAKVIKSQGKIVNVH